MAKHFIHSLVMAWLIPAVMISALAGWYGKNDDDTALPENSSGNYEIKVLSMNGETKMMELESYVTCVILGEVSPEFHEEALKAQAVAARTYTLYCIEVLRKHAGGAVCTDYHCCQSFCEPEKYLDEGGTVQSLNKVKTAVQWTAGEILRYGPDLICATYFASSGGKTEDAEEVWGREYPYLRSTDSPGEEECGYFSKQVRFSPVELQTALGVQLTGKPSSWFGMIKYTVGGGVDLMRIGGRLYTGVELRKLLNLRSTVMAFTATDDTIIIDTKGYGHRVGMSQHGADAMASNGSNYRDILAHYYADTVLDQAIR